MHVSDIVTSKYGSNILLAAYGMDREGTEKIEAAYQEAWDSGMGFTFETMFNPREDEKKEMDECANQMQGALRELIVKTWLCRYNRDEIIELCKMLMKCPQKRYTRIDLEYKLDICVDDIARKWLELHPDEPKFYLPVDDIG